jgi:hypothetical protein
MYLIKKLGALFLRLGQLVCRFGLWLSPSTGDAAFNARLRKWQKLWFVVDIPLFIDSVAVRQLYDALSRPDFDTASRVIGTVTSEGSEYQTEAALSVEYGIPPFAKSSVTGKGSKKKVRSSSLSSSLTQEANKSAEMRFEKIVSFYAEHYPGQIFWTTSDVSILNDTDGKNLTWDDVSNRINGCSPRPLIVLDLPAESKLIPMAGELTSGKVKRLFEDLVGKSPGGDTVPDYPSDKSPVANKLYWESLDLIFDSKIAMEVVEDGACEGARYDWIDYRLMARSGGDIIPLHLHLTPRGEFNSGVFAYQTIRRCKKFGLKIVGTLKQGGDVNVLAMYEN